MARKFADSVGSVESGDWTGWTSTSGSPTVVASDSGIVPVHGSFMMRHQQSGPGTDRYGAMDQAGSTNSYGRLHLHFGAATGGGGIGSALRGSQGTTVIFDIEFSYSAPDWFVRATVYSTSGSPASYDTGWVLAYPSQWNCVTWYYHRASADAQFICVINGVIKLNQSGFINTNYHTRSYVGWIGPDTGDAGALLLDAFACDDSDVIDCAGAVLAPPPFLQINGPDFGLLT